MNENETSDHELSIDDVLITGELTRRVARSPDWMAESRAMQLLARETAANPHKVLHKLARLAMVLCRADSAGVSVLEPGASHGLIRWHAAAGRLSHHLNRSFAPGASPCGEAIERGEVLLFDRAERCFPAMRGLGPAVHEQLTAPWRVDGRPAGTLWVLAHQPGPRFDAEDARLLSALGAFAAAICRTRVAPAQAGKEQRQQEARVEEGLAQALDGVASLEREAEQRRVAEAALHATETLLMTELDAMRSLHELHARLASETDLSAALAAVLETACTLTRADRGCIQLPSADGTRLDIAVRRGPDPDSLCIAHFPHAGLAPDSKLTRARRLLIEDTRNETALAGKGEAADAGGILAVQSTPMISRKGENCVCSTCWPGPAPISSSATRPWPSCASANSARPSCSG